MTADDADNGAMRRWVNEILESYLSVALLHRGMPDAAQRMLTPHEAELRGYVAAGALTLQQAGAWRARFARAARALELPDADAATQPVRARAERLLDEHIAAMKAGDRAAFQRLYSALSALHHVGAISSQAYDGYRARAKPAPRAAPQTPPPPSRAPFDATVLKRVVAGPTARLTAVRLICAELYADCVTLRWHRLLTPEETRARDEFNPFANFPDGLLEQGRRWGADFELRDDRGTRYERVAGDSAMTHDYTRRRDSKATPVWGYATFVPQAPKDAIRLYAINGSDRFALTLTDA